MQNRETSHRIKVSIFMFITGCLGFITVTAFDKLYWHTDILAQGYPDFSHGYLIRSVVIFVSVIFLLLAVIGKKKPELILAGHHKLPVEMICILGTLFISIICLLLFLFFPITFSLSSLEDELIEWLSAILAFGSSIILFIFVMKFRNHVNIPFSAKLSLVFLSLLFFIIGMEEVSWFQRILHFQTIGMFDGNQQNETNLHNFANDYFENLYYGGTYLFFVILPFLVVLFSSLNKSKYLRLFIARPYIAVIGTLPCAYNFDAWNILFIQASFFSSLIILFCLAVFSKKRIEQCIIILTMILVMITQGLFLMKGEEVFMRLWEIKEYKEFFIPLVFFIYSADVSTHLNRVYAAETSWFPLAFE